MAKQTILMNDSLLRVLSILASLSINYSVIHTNKGQFQFPLFNFSLHRKQGNVRAPTTCGFCPATEIFCICTVRGLNSSLSST